MAPGEAEAHFSNSSAMHPQRPNEGQCWDKNLLGLPGCETASPFTAVNSTAWPTIIIPQEGAVSAPLALARPRETADLNPSISKVPLSGSAQGGEIEASSEGKVCHEYSQSSPLTTCIRVCVRRGAEGSRHCRGKEMRRRRRPLKPESSGRSSLDRFAEVTRPFIRRPPRTTKRH